MKRRTFLTAMGLGLTGSGFGLPGLAQAFGVVAPEQELILDGLELSYLPDQDNWTRIEVAGVGLRGARMARALAFGNHLPAVSQFHFFEGRDGEATAQDLDFENTSMLAIISDFQTPRVRQLCEEIADEARERGVPLCTTLVTAPVMPYKMRDGEMAVSDFLESCPYLGRTIPIARGLTAAAQCLRGLTDTIGSQLTLNEPLTMPMIGVDLADVTTILAGTGPATHGFGQASGDSGTRGRVAALAALRQLDPQFLAPNSVNWVASIQANQSTSQRPQPGPGDVGAGRTPLRDRQGRRRQLRDHGPGSRICLVDRKALQRGTQLYAPAGVT